MIFKQNLYLQYFYLKYKFFLKKLLKIITHASYKTAVSLIYKPWYRYFFFRNTNIFYNYLYNIQLKIKKLLIKVSNTLYFLFYISTSNKMIKWTGAEDFYLKSEEYLFFKLKRNTLLVFFQFLMYTLFLVLVPNYNISIKGLKLYLNTYINMIPTLHMFYFKKKLL